MQSNVFKVKPRLLVLLLLPASLVYGFIILTPLIFSLRYSFFKWSGGKNMDFIFLDNYKRLLIDEDFWHAFGNNIKLVVLIIIFQIGISFILAVMITPRRTLFQAFHRFSIFLPVVVAPVVVSILWKLIYNTDVGILNTVLRSIGLESLIRPWLSDPDYVIYSVSVVIIWQFIGLYLVIFMAGLQGIPDEIYEVAYLDGASAYHRLTKITIPLMLDTIVVAVMLSIAGNMKVFDHIFVMTGGGPGKSSSVIAMEAYGNAFNKFQYGYSAAMSIGILILSLSLVFLSRLPLAIANKRNREGQM